MNYADFGKRFLAYLIDTGILLLGYIIIFIPFIFICILFITSSQNDNSTSQFFGLAFFAGIIFAVILMFWLMLYLWVWHPYKNNGQSFGKKIMGIKIIRLNKEMTLGTYFGRFAIFYLLGAISGITIFFNDEKQSIHDMVVNTIVIEV